MGSILWTETHLKYGKQRRRKLKASNEQVPIPNDVNCHSSYIETPNGHVLHIKCLIPKREYIFTEDQKIKGMICCCLGYTSHVNWTMTSIALDWCQKGYIFFMHDHYGHGASEGLYHYSKNFQHIVNDTYFIFEWAKKIFTPSQIKNKNLKFNYFIMGHSMGANVALQIALKYQHEVRKCRNNNLQDNDEKYNENDFTPDSVPNSIKYAYNGMILTSPMIKIADDTKPGAMVTFILKNILLNIIPSAPVVPSSASNMSQYNTRDKEKLKFMNRDPLEWNLNPRLATAWNLVSACDFVEGQLENIYLPFKVLHGTEDKITDYNASDLLFKKTGTPRIDRRKSIKIYQGGAHHLLMDECSKEVYDDLTNWMDAQSYKVEIEYKEGNTFDFDM